MHPALSIIFFTTASGAGYGLLVLLGLGAAFDMLPADRWFGLVGLGLSLGLISAGLVSSTFHLGHPERAWRALSQWRSSWLSREGVMAIVTYGPAGLLGIGWVFLESTGGFWALCGVLAAALAIVTVYCTSMIYGCLKTIRQWHNHWVPPVFLGFAFATGAQWLYAVEALFGMAAGQLPAVAMMLTAVAWGLKGLYWRSLSAGAPAHTTETATGLGHIGAVRMLDPPHNQENYLLREMGHRIARKHAFKLRRLAVLCGLVLPIALLPLASVTGGAIAAVAALLAAIAGSAGVVVERWLFFAEAQHTVTLYYGSRAA